MSKSILERYWRGPSVLRNHNVVSCVLKEIQCDIRAGSVFPALRENEIHLYHEGGRLLRIRPQSAYSHSKYARGCGSGEVSLPPGWLTSAKYEELKDRCRERNSKCLTDDREARRETWIVSRLFKRFSVWADEACPDQPKLIDVEVRLRCGIIRSARMVDLLFLDDDARLTFVEVKREYDGRVRSTETPEVVEQICRYEKGLIENQNDVVCAYSKAGDVLGEAFGLNPFGGPAELFKRVPILVCRGRRKENARDTWLRDQLTCCADGRVDPKSLVVDGGAIERPADGNAPHPKWCADGRWEKLDLKMVFETIRSAKGCSNALGGDQ